jgi:hypothetical protein
VRQVWMRRTLTYMVGLAALVAVSLLADESLGASVSKLVSQIKVPSNVVSDTALRGLAAKLQTGDPLPSCPHLSV